MRRIGLCLLSLGFLIALAQSCRPRIIKLTADSLEWIEGGVAATIEHDGIRKLRLPFIEMMWCPERRIFVARSPLGVLRL